MVIVSPLRIGLWDPFQMAILWLIKSCKWGWSLPLTNWDDPPSRGPISPHSLRSARGFCRIETKRAWRSTAMTWTPFSRRPKCWANSKNPSRRDDCHGDGVFCCLFVCDLFGCLFVCLVGWLFVFFCCFVLFCSCFVCLCFVCVLFCLFVFCFVVVLFCLIVWFVRYSIIFDWIFLFVFGFVNLFLFEIACSCLEFFVVGCFWFVEIDVGAIQGGPLPVINGVITPVGRVK